jgi:hypothetical protein
VVCARIMDIGGAIIPHAIAGLLAWLVVQFFPYRPDSKEPEERPVEGLGLGL